MFAFLAADKVTQLTALVNMLVALPRDVFYVLAIVSWVLSVGLLFVVF